MIRDEVSTEDVNPNVQEARMFWNNTGDNLVNHNKYTVWLTNVRRKLVGQNQPDLGLTNTLVSKFLENAE